MPYQKPAVITERTGLPGTPLGNTAFFTPLVIGKSLGKATVYSRLATDVSDGDYVSINGIGVAVGDTLDYAKVTFTNSTKLTAAVPYPPVISILSVSSSAADPFKREYIENTDFTVNKTTGVLDFTDAPAIQVPEFSDISEGTGGSIDTGNYNVAIVARDANSVGTTPAYYSSGGNDYFTIASASATMTIKWSKVRNASSYLVYAKPTSATAAQWKLVGTISNGTTTSLTVTAAIAADTVNLATTYATNASKHTPLDADTVYVAYTYGVYSYNSAKRFFDTETLQQDHGIGSEIANAGRLVMGPLGVGQNAGSMYAVAVSPSDGDVIGFQNAIDACESVQELILISTTSTSDLVNDTLKAHCEDMSKPENAKERFGFVSTTATVQSDSDVSVLTAKIAALASNRMIFVTTDGGRPYINSWQNTINRLNIIDNETKDDNYTLNQAVDGQWHAMAMMGMVAKLADPATPPTNKQVYGISSGEEGTVQLWNDARKDAVAAIGGTVLEDRYNQLWIRHALTTSQASVEDSEVSIVLAEAYMAKRLRDNHAQFIGQKLTNLLLNGVTATSRRTLKGLIGDVIIRSYTELNVYQDTAKPTWVYVLFSYKPIYPTNVIKFEWGFDIAG